MYKYDFNVEFVGMKDVFFLIRSIKLCITTAILVLDTYTLY
jgi:hypothetical protein